MDYGKVSQGETCILNVTVKAAMLSHIQDIGADRFVWLNKAVQEKIERDKKQKEFLDAAFIESPTMQRQ